MLIELHRHRNTSVSWFTEFNAGCFGIVRLSNGRSQSLSRFFTTVSGDAASLPISTKFLHCNPLHHTQPNALVYSSLIYVLTGRMHQRHLSFSRS